MTTHPALSRRSFLRGSLGGAALLAGGGLLVACGDGGPSSGDGTVTDLAVQLNWVKNVEHAPYYIADAEGFFEQNGVSVDLLAGGPNVPLAPTVLAGGGAQIGVANVMSEVLNARSSGTDLVVLGALYQQSLNGFISLASNPVRSLSDLVGKRLGFQYAGYEEMIQLTMRAGGVDPTFTSVLIGSDASALLEGEVDVFLGYISNHPVTLRQRGVETAVLPLQDVGLVDYSDLIIAQRSFVTENREAVVGYLRALSLGVEKNNSDGPEPGARLTVDDYGAELGLDLQAQIASNEIYIASTQSDATRANGVLWIDLDHVEGPVFESLRLQNVPADQLTDPQGWIDLGPLQESRA